ncbi:MAG: LLM class flavin-dependent oxidoreductase [Actinomyces sp.]|nr:MAG: LLM class flavin-dependent oxidoreductase [Actinomyces sp.]
MRHGLFFPPFGPLADPRLVAEVAVEAEAAGWDGLFLWDHVLRARPLPIVDPWICLAAAAARTQRLRLGCLVTPLVRRRPITVVRQALALDLLSSGRLVLGFGLGVDTGGELSRFGEITDPRRRGEYLDEAVDVVAALLEGDTVDVRGRHLTVNEVRIEPRPVQEPRPPIWLAARGRAPRPVRRAARFDGIFPIEIDADDYRWIVDTLVATRGSLDDFDIVVHAERDGSVPGWADEHVTWVLESEPEEVDPDRLAEVVAAGPPG